MYNDLKAFNARAVHLLYSNRKYTGNSASRRRNIGYNTELRRQMKPHLLAGNFASLNQALIYWRAYKDQYEKK